MEILVKMGLMWPRTYATHHRAKPLLQSLYTEDCPVNCVPEWSIEKIEAAIRTQVYGCLRLGPFEV